MPDDSNKTLGEVLDDPNDDRAAWPATDDGTQTPDDQGDDFPEEEGDAGVEDDGTEEWYQEGED